jgi:hypothetical protein
MLDGQSWHGGLHEDRHKGEDPGQRFAITARGGDPKWRYAATYDLETDDATQVIADLTGAVKTLNMSDSIDGANAALWILAPVGDRHVIDSTLTAS